MDTTQLLDVVRSLLAQPTAPFHEDAVRGEICQQLAQCPNVTLEIDDFSNVIATYSRGDLPPPPRYAFAAHMDHPGYVHGKFLGGVPREYLETKAPTRDFGAFEMWDLPAFELADGRIHSRACDDLIGCAAIVAMFKELERIESPETCLGLFTRAEEVGFVGAVQLAQSGRLPREIIVVSLETSSERANACRMGDGVILRVGDRTSIFDDRAMRELTELAKRAGLPAQRCLMSGGTCEATAYQLYDYRVAALCVALGNYHNLGPDTTIAAEYVALADVQALTNLCIAAASEPRPSADVHTTLRAKLEAGAEQYRRYF